MIVYKDKNRAGRDAAEEAFLQLVSTTPPATAIERASYLCGMQTYCRRQLQRELSSAMDALESGAATTFEPRCEDILPRPHRSEPNQAVEAITPQRP